MQNPIAQKEILVSGHAAADRISDMLPQLGGGLTLRTAHTKKELIKELSEGRQPICIIEHQVSLTDPEKKWSNFFRASGAGSALASFLMEGFLSKQQFSLPPEVTAYELLPELVSKSSETQFVITSHERGSGLSSEQRTLYKGRKEVLKVMGFVNSSVNYVYLMKLFSRVYLGKAWNPKQTN